MCPHGYHHSGSMATPALGTRDVYIYIVNCYQLQLAMAESARLKEHNYAIFIRK